MSLVNEEIEDGELALDFNEKQASFLEQCLFGFPVGTRKDAGLVGGRGGGKSHTMASLIQLMANELPKAKGQFACVAVTKVKRAITPGLKASWNDPSLWNLREYDWNTKEGDYCLWREPPKDWDRPYQQPDDWSNCISFPTGYVVEFCGYMMDPDAHRGRNDDFVLIDEALKFKEEWLAALLPCIRANRGKFESPLHWLFAFFSSPPYGVEGSWMYKYEKLAQAEPDKHYFTFIKTTDNQAFLPPDYVDNLRKTLLRIQFEVEVEGKRIQRPEKAFYPAFSKIKHAPELDIEVKFYNAFAPLEASIDLNAHFTSATMWQPVNRELRLVKNCFVKEPLENMSMAETLAQKINDDFGHHQVKKIVITGDRNGKNKTAQTKFIDGKWVTPYDEMAQILEPLGWDVILAPINFNSFGYDRQMFMHKILVENDPTEYYIRIDPIDANHTIISIENAPIHPDYSKNKSSETSGIDQELATHLSDTVDYYCEYKKTGGITWTTGSFEIDFM